MYLEERIAQLEAAVKQNNIEIRELKNILITFMEKENHNLKEKDTFSKKEAREYLGSRGRPISETKLWMLLKKGKIKGRHETGYDGYKGKFPYFYKDTLDAYIESISR